MNGEELGNTNVNSHLPAIKLTETQKKFCLFVLSCKCNTAFAFKHKDKPATKLNTVAYHQKPDVPATVFLFPNFNLVAYKSVLFAIKP